MEILKCLAVDDEPHALELLETYIEKVPFLTMFKTTTSPWEALKVLEEDKADLLFLDIQMIELSGLQLLEIGNTNCPVTITSAYPQYAIDGFNFEVSDYLLKPFSFERFMKAVQKVKSRFLEQTTQNNDWSDQMINQEYIFLKGDSKNKFYKIYLSDILYIEGLKNYVRFICKDGNIITLQTMKDLEERLPGRQFMRVHRSFIINLNRIEKVDGNTLFIGEQMIPIGQSYRSAFVNVIRNNRLG